ncbi:hypothetical protein CYMTET_25956 [Cymbomonas tetramitiformis]|uniref:RING-type domain-containing protein n=1 Tax=Cymbomonas tetramitiformis TaxID=36881 RepID=A0AAE0FST3_9CHLO|nr:hypothetical protein CYMTET_25956 [Cymbomonas tetramitiformis]
MIEEEVAQVRLQMMAMKEEIAKQDALNKAEQATQLARLRLQQQEIDAQKTAAGAAVDVHSAAAPYAAHGRELQAKQVEVARLEAANTEMSTKLQQALLDSEKAQRAAAHSVASLEEQVAQLQLKVSQEHASLVAAQSRLESMHENMSAVQRSAKNEISNVTGAALEEKQALADRTKEMEAIVEQSARQSIQADQELRRWREDMAVMQESVRHLQEEKRQIQIKLERTKEEGAQEVQRLQSEFKQEKLLVLAELEGEHAARCLRDESHAVTSREAAEKTNALTAAEAEIASLSTFLSASQEAADMLRIALAKEEESTASRTKESLEIAERVEATSARELQQAHEALHVERRLREEADVRFETTSKELTDLTAFYIRTGGADAIRKLPEIQCTLCAKLLKQPHTMAMCSHTFCKECALPQLYEESKCPQCKIRANRADLVPNMPLIALTNKVWEMLDKNL